MASSSLSVVRSSSDHASASSAEKRRMILGLGGLALCLILSGGVIWWYFIGSSPARSQVTVDPKDQTWGFAGGRGAQRIRPRDIIPAGKDAWLVRGADGQMKVTNNSGMYELGSFSYVGGLKVSQEQIALLTARWRILRDAAMAKAWGVTPKQRSALAKLKGSGNFDPTSQQRVALNLGFMDYIQASDEPTRVDKKASLLNQLDDLARQSFPASHDAYVQRADEIRKILTADQIKKILK